MSDSASGTFGGTPSTTTPIAGPWLSPQVVKRYSVPSVLPAMTARLDDRNVGGVGAFHADDVIAAIDVVHLPGDPGRQIAQQINPGAADILDRDVALQRRIELVPFEDVVEIADPRGGQRPDRTGRDRVDPDVVAAEIDGEILDARLERRLGHSHHVVVRHDPLGPSRGQGEE